MNIRNPMVIKGALEINPPKNGLAVNLVIKS